MRPTISDRSIGSTEMPAASSSFSLKRTVLNAAGRAPIAPMRRPRSPFTTRQTPRNQSRSRANSGERRRLGVPAGERVADAVLLQVVAGRHLAAEAVAPVLDRHQRRRVGRRLHQDRHVQVGHAQRVRDAALVAEVRQRHDDAVDLVPVPPEEVGARPRLGPRLDRAVLRVLRPEHDDLDARLLQDRRSSPRGRSWPGGPGRSPGCRRSVQWSLIPHRLAALGSGSGLTAHDGVTARPPGPEPRALSRLRLPIEVEVRRHDERQHDARTRRTSHSSSCLASPAADRR